MFVVEVGLEPTPYIFKGCCPAIRPFHNVVVSSGFEPEISESKSLVLPLHYETIKKPYSIRLNRVCKVLTIRYRYQSVRLICCCWYCDVVFIILFINILFLCRDGRIRTCEFSCSQSRRGNRTPQHLVLRSHGESNSELRRDRATL